MRKHGVLLGAFILLVFPATGFSQRTADSACILCHQDVDLLGEESAAIVEAFQGDVHRDAGLSCHDCHGGNPDPALAEDLEASMDETYVANPFQPAPEKRNIPSFCGKCHSDPSYMKRFRPDARVDQEAEYWTSRHGMALRQGDVNVATCVDCHGAHGILHAADPQSSVFPKNVATTCRECHANAELMSGYTGPSGNPLRIDQYARWRQSVHAQAMFDREDLSAPTCNDCHGNHGAAPPGLENIAYVCGQCHGRESSLFRESPKNEALELHSEFLAEAGPDSCNACHEDKPRGELPLSQFFGECSSCHGNHGIVRPNTAMFSPLPETPCAFCHEAPADLMTEFPELERTREHFEAIKAGLLEEGRAEGLQGDDLYDWMVDQALALPFHSGGEGTTEEGPAQLKPEYAELFRKFRIGKTYFTYADPASGELVKGRVVRCSTCHSEESTGSEIGHAFLSRIQELEAVTAAAERRLLAARRAGMETREAAVDVKSAVDSQISLTVLIHTFDLESGFSDEYQEGMGYARAALEAGRAAHEELQTRRLGLAAALVAILLFLVGLGFKIHEVSAREARGH